MKTSVKFSLRSTLWATLLCALWAGLIVTDGFGLEAIAQSYPVVGAPLGLLVTALPSAAVGTLLGRADIGVLCGVVTGLSQWLQSLS